MTSLSRRSFARTLSLSGLAYAGFKLTGCGPLAEVETGVSGVDTVYVAETVTMYDMLMEAWSTLGGGRLGDTGTLKAAQVQTDKDVTLKYTQDGDGHTFTLTKADLRKLRKGQSVSVLTTENFGHRHEVRIDPKKNQIPGSQGLEMPVDPDATLPPPPPSERLFATLEERDDTKLYVAGSAEMDPDSVEYCLEPADRCAQDASLWHRMKTHVSTGRTNQMFVSDTALSIDVSQAEQALSLRAKVKNGGSAVSQLFKLLKQVIE